MAPQLSVIIPTLNEENSVGLAIASCCQGPDIEVLVVDGGSQDKTRSIAEQAGATILASPPGRAGQLNRGAAHARGDLLIFLHADSLLPQGFHHLVADTLTKPGVAGGAFSLHIDSRRKILHYVGIGANLRSRVLGMPYGDQALFVGADLFTAVGGFPELEIMEDYVFIRRLHSHGKIITLPQSVTTSARRWERMGIVRTTLINQVMICGYSLGVPTPTLARWYQRARGVSTKD